MPRRIPWIFSLKSAWTDHLAVGTWRPISEPVACGCAMFFSPQREWVWGNGHWFWHESSFPVQGGTNDLHFSLFSRDHRRLRMPSSFLGRSRRATQAHFRFSTLLLLCCEPRMFLMFMQCAINYAHVKLGDKNVPLTFSSTILRSSRFRWRRKWVNFIFSFHLFRQRIVDCGFLLSLLRVMWNSHSNSAKHQNTPANGHPAQIGKVWSFEPQQDGHAFCLHEGTVQGGTTGLCIWFCFAAEWGHLAPAYVTLGVVFRSEMVFSANFHFFQSAAVIVHETAFKLTSQFLQQQIQLASFMYGKKMNMTSRWHLWCRPDNSEMQDLRRERHASKWICPFWHLVLLRWEGISAWKWTRQNEKVLHQEGDTYFDMLLSHAGNKVSFLDKSENLTVKKNVWKLLPLWKPCRQRSNNFSNWFEEVGQLFNVAHFGRPKNDWLEQITQMHPGSKTSLSWWR